MCNEANVKAQMSAFAGELGDITNEIRKVGLQSEFKVRMSLI
jgi:hypothetical protein